MQLSLRLWRTIGGMSLDERGSADGKQAARTWHRAASWRPFLPLIRHSGRVPEA
jgi:hypothetical protein